MSASILHFVRRTYRLQNWPLALGGLGLLILLTLTVAGSRLAPQEPLQVNFMVLSNGRFLQPPHAPSPQFRLGSDRMGRDVLSGLLTGARYTLLFTGITVGMALLVALPVGLIAGWRGGLLAATTQALSVGTTAIPQLLGAGLLLQRVHAQQGQYSLTQQVIACAVVLSLLAAPRLAQVVRQLTVQLRSDLYVEAAASNGATVWRILWRHLLPNMMHPLTTVALLEFASILRLLALLGVFSIFIAPTEAYEMSVGEPPAIGYYPAIPEWASYMGFAYTNATISWWILIFPGLAITFAIGVCHLLAEGLHRHWRL